MRKMGKHAYLILAHKDDDTFRTLLRLIDDERNDIFIHMDRKNHEYNYVKTEKSIMYSNVMHVSPRISVTWGAYSAVEAELELLRKATMSGTYDYYHLLSGEDLPIKSQDYIHNFFSKHKGKELVQFQSKTFNYDDRVQFFYVFQQLIGRGDKCQLLSKINQWLLCLQRRTNICRNRKVNFQKGAQWFSITDEFARYVVSQTQWIKKVFRYTFCADEIFLQTILYNSSYKERLLCDNYEDSIFENMRLIDWNRGRPYVFSNGDQKELADSEMLFARKFDCRRDKDIIAYVEKTLAKGN